MIRMAAITLGLQLAFVVPAAAQTDDLRYFVGHWNVASKDPASGEVLQLEYSIEPTRGGAWLAGLSVSKDGSLSARDMWGRDPLTGEVIRVIFDGSGTFATVRSRGWTGDKLVLEGEARSKGGTVRVRETISRLSPQQFDAVWEAHRNGVWSAYAVETVIRR
ncbi:hypothetical protein LJR219_004326 [Phenylobacterium sp. LjRoot219]|uniref:hypothetical protein n=1 Tax=Phenylobacterium sp. LjRoot219 TaxID=3342283 RepID=UPI003ECE59D1